jgi:hypothetical protein
MEVTHNSKNEGMGDKPFLVMSAAPAPGHLGPALHVASELVKRGYEGVFLTAAPFKELIASTGMEYAETTFWDMQRLAEMPQIPLGLDRVAFDMEKLFIAEMQGRWEALSRTLTDVRDRIGPERQVIVISEVCGLGHLPLALGAPLPKGYTARPKIMAINGSTLWAGSIDIFPYGTGLPPDYSEAGRARSQVMRDLLLEHRYSSMVKRQAEILKGLGCTTIPEGIPMDAWCNSYDACMQLCSPSLEYPRSDLHPSIRYTGLLPKMGLNPAYAYPEWWPEVLEKEKSGKKIVFVTQGTVAVQYEQLIIPTVTGLADRSDLLVIVALGAKGATLPAEVAVPSNTRVADYIPYDAVLEHADIFVTNGGYGSFVHAVNNGVPCVMAGLSEDKMEVSARAEWAGFAINLKTQNPTVDQVVGAVDRIFGDVSYKRRAERLRMENEDYAPFDLIERQLKRWAE